MFGLVWLAMFPLGWTRLLMHQIALSGMTNNTKQTPLSQSCLQYELEQTSGVRNQLRKKKRGTRREGMKEKKRNAAQIGAFSSLNGDDNVSESPKPMSELADSVPEPAGSTWVGLEVAKVDMLKTSPNNVPAVSILAGWSNQRGLGGCPAHRMWGVSTRLGYRKRANIIEGAFLSVRACTDAGEERRKAQRTTRVQERASQGASANSACFTQEACGRGRGRLRKNPEVARMSLRCHDEWIKREK
ncbi:uncharacterized protein EI90DRAFT_3014693 [Cantharellus anzutake]|uniref:uncharacterized protein n=1 Tax=Cantharellus anzutake TaxID=1750568 RepID=UPI0019052F07|nr:uncharacterized protein EI90DRAFT_3014693 [Cantharellus anzutake]KAF8335461.1 hypothetical protein EI90DRAFT_3014693 [Cantharellus anzutake]